MKLKNLFFRGTFLGCPQIVLILRLIVILFLLITSRILLYVFNPNFFQGASEHLLYYIFTGIRFDLVALVYVNLAYIFLLIIPFRFRRNKNYVRSSNILFYITNSILLLPNFIDLVYYRFTLKRLSSEIFTLVGGSQIDIFDLLPIFLRDYWYILALWIVFIVILVFITKKIQIAKHFDIQSNLSYYISQFLIMIPFLGLSVLGMRGGIQLKPLSTLHVSQYAQPNHAALVLNSAFTIIRSSGQKGLKPLYFYKNTSELNSIFNPQKNYSTLDSAGAKLPMSKPNIVIIILESFSIEHIGSLNNQSNTKSFTPFLDSIISKSIVFKGFSNGKRSIEGIPAIVSSMPSWMQSDFISSPYSGNHYSSIAGLLKNEGYNSAFFHGGKNGTMGFDSYLLAAGFEKYYGKDEYPDQRDFDDHWGIWDEPYLQYVANKASSFKSPFFAAVFTLSSHHPYNIPDKYKNKFQKGKLPIQQAIMYSDFALSKFFEFASHMPWFSNTLFIITADHTSEADIPYFQTSVGQHEIPIIFYNFKDTTLFNRALTAQQTDILPTILDYIHYPHPFIAFGNSLLQKNEPHYSLANTSAGFQLIQSDYCLQCDENLSPMALFKFSTDSLLKVNLIHSEQQRVSNMLRLSRASIQQYNDKMINNTLIIK